jgi:2-polyprenyl-6-methoxyphenol hydroxylase-like FAD-dependent oxidoreductase
VRQLDVAIVGGGLAGNLLARQLRLACPELRVGLFEQSTATSYKVGEATVEIAANYLTRKQGLTNYLYEHHLPKNGLRYCRRTACAISSTARIARVHSNE